MLVTRVCSLPGRSETPAEKVTEISRRDRLPNRFDEFPVGTIPGERRCSGRVNLAKLRRAVKPNTPDRCEFTASFDLTSINDQLDESSSPPSVSCATEFSFFCRSSGFQSDYRRARRAASLDEPWPTSLIDLSNGDLARVFSKGVIVSFRLTGPQ